MEDVPLNPGLESEVLPRLRSINRVHPSKDGE